MISISALTQPTPLPAPLEPTGNKDKEEVDVEILPAVTEPPTKATEEPKEETPKSSSPKQLLSPSTSPLAQHPEPAAEASFGPPTDPELPAPVPEPETQAKAENEEAETQKGSSEEMMDVSMEGEPEDPDKPFNIEEIQGPNLSDDSNSDSDSDSESYKSGSGTSNSNPLSRNPSPAPEPEEMEAKDKGEKELPNTEDKEMVEAEEKPILNNLNIESTSPVLVKNDEAPMNFNITEPG